MPTFIALLRGVNVGKAKQVPMADLRALLAELGYADVQTLLNSGNAVFRATKGAPAELAVEITHAIATKLQLEVPVIVKSAAQWSAIVADNALAANAADDPSRLLVAVTQGPEALAGLGVIEPLLTPAEAFFLGANAAYLHCASGILESRAGEALLGKVGKVGKTATTRNWATVLKLQALAKGLGA
ncbi:DUF1697 domain-containing protein [Paucibacter sp. AS339]|uniref:DUF1697 domain-containing protein n=1 Tax=Paucibacter hankyongi TaxID=3133434 RepID=UPI0030B043CF